MMMTEDHWGRMKLGGGVARSGNDSMPLAMEASEAFFRQSLLRHRS